MRESAQCVSTVQLIMDLTEVDFRVLGQDWVAAFIRNIAHAYLEDRYDHRIMEAVLKYDTHLTAGQLLTIVGNGLEKASMEDLRPLIESVMHCETLSNLPEKFLLTLVEKKFGKSNEIARLIRKVVQ